MAVLQGLGFDVVEAAIDARPRPQLQPHASDEQL
jgi:hypothetical protein